MALNPACKILGLFNRSRGGKAIELWRVAFNLGRTTLYSPVEMAALT
jgi:hypothetical protein